MNNLSKTLLGASLLAVMASCSSNEPAGPGQDGPGGDVAYMKIRISSATDSRAVNDSNVNGNYKPSDDVEKEHDVKDLKFYFFDENGNYVNLEASVTNPGVTNSGANRPNVEFLSNAGYLVLEGLHQNNYPTYMLTVINMPDFQCPGTLAAASSAIHASDVRTSDFAMSTSSYFKVSNGISVTDDHHDDAYCYATKLLPGDFKLTIDDARNANPVQVYVERLAAKAQVNVNATSETATLNGQQITVYPLEQTLAGNVNSGTTELNTKLYIHVLGWGLNATNPDSNVSKQLRTAWATAEPLSGWTAWNDPSRYRSYWGESNVYDLNATALGNKLDYFTLAELNKKLVSEYDYCYENTHEAGLPIYDFSKNAVDSRYVTHAVLDTEVGTVENGVFKPISMITYRGLLYRDEAYRAYILSNMKNAGQINLYVKSGNDYTEIDGTSLKFVTANDGLGSVKLMLDETNASTKYFIKAGADYVNAKDADITAFKNNLASAQSYKAVRHTDGRSVYYIPVEHHTDGNAVNQLAYYGVVRNHWYEINVNKFTRVGHGVFDPETETIKPDGPEDPLYYVGARINILSWKLVRQSVDL